MDLGVTRKLTCDLLLVFWRYLLLFSRLTLKARKWLIFPTPPLFDAPAFGNLLEFPYETMQNLEAW